MIDNDSLSSSDSEYLPSSSHSNDSTTMSLHPVLAEELPNDEVVEVQSLDDVGLPNDTNLDIQSSDDNEGDSRSVILRERGQFRNRVLLRPNSSMSSVSSTSSSNRSDVSVSNEGNGSFTINTDIFPALPESVNEVHQQIMTQCDNGTNRNQSFVQRQYDQFYQFVNTIPAEPCPICRRNDATLDWIMLPCGHIFCTPCISRLFNIHGINRTQRCPSCMGNCTRNEVSRLGARPASGQNPVPIEGTMTYPTNDGNDIMNNDRGTVNDPVDLTQSNSSP